MRKVLFILLLAGIFGAAMAGAGSLIHLELIDHGILANGDGLAGKSVQIGQRTERVPGREGLAFGMVFRLMGERVESDIAYQTEITFRRAQGVPQDGSPRFRLAKTRHSRLGETEALWHRLTREQAAVPGQWLLRISHEGRVLLEKTFLVEPEQPTE
ncbi:MAG: DUF3859 domain-containing protein [Desulfovibrio sp.]